MSEFSNTESDAKCEASSGDGPHKISDFRISRTVPSGAKPVSMNR
jgi:hypothetical protein